MTGHRNTLPPDDMTLPEVASRLGKSVRWLQTLLAEDERRRPGDRKFQFHHHIGASKQWTETGYQALKSAIIENERKKRQQAISFHSRVPKAAGIGHRPE